MTRTFVGIRATLISALVLVGCGQQTPRPQRVTSALYARQDSNATTVWAPRIHAGAQATEALALDMSYTVDAWTSASVDIVTSASKRPVQELRTEVNAGASYEFDNASVSGGYRYSGENDYWSNGGTGNLTLNLANNNTLLGFAVFGSKDVVGRSGDPGFRRPQTSAGGRVTLTQVLDKYTVVQLAAETLHLSGFLSSPYRFVGIMGNGICGAIPDAPVGTAPLCLPESHPHARTRSSGTIALRRALGDKVSLGASYRYYFDDWGIRSHMVGPDMAFVLGEHDMLRVTLRGYGQGRADFYRSRYTDDGAPPRYFTRDRKMTSMRTWHAGLEYGHEFEVGTDSGTLLHTTLRLGYTRLQYDAFLGLSVVDAYEATALLSLDFR